MDGMEITPVLKHKKVLIADGDLAGGETAIHLAQEGKKVLIPGTHVICALGQRSNRNMVNKLIDTTP